MQSKTNKKYTITTMVAIVLIFAFLFVQIQLSGKAISDLDITYTEGQPIKGTLTITTYAGELIPAGSVLKLTTENSNYEFLLKDILNDQQLEGSYYVEGKNLIGSGSGFGKYGNTENLPDLSFTLVIEDEETVTEEETTEETPAEEETEEEETTEETPAEETNETIIEEETPAEEETEEEPTEEVIEEIAEEETEEEPTEEVIEEIAEEEEAAEEVIEEAEDEAAEEIPEELFDIKVALEDNEIRDPSTLVTFVTLESFGQTAPTIDVSYYIIDQANNQIYARTQRAVVQTEKIIKRVFTDFEARPGKYTLLVKTHYGENVQDKFTEEFTILPKTLFQKILSGIKSIFRPQVTGNVVSTWNGETEITGTLNEEESYTIEVPEGKTVTILSGSIKDGSTTLNNNEIKISKNGNFVTLTTTYQNEDTKGFGESYLGSIDTSFTIDLTALDLTFETGKLTVTLEHENITIAEITEILGEEETEAPSEILTIEDPTEEKLTERLTVLSELLDGSSMQTTTKTVNNKLVVKHEIDIYWATFSYDSNLGTSKLEEWKLIDQRRFTEELINALT